MSPTYSMFMKKEKEINLASVYFYSVELSKEF